MTAAPILTESGRRLLVQRVTTLREAGLPALRLALAEPGRDPSVVLDYERAVGEIQRLEAVLAAAVPLEATPHDPAVVELGDLVVLELDTGEIERFLLVDPAEAALDDRRISVRSPLARALIGRRVGDSVDVTGPAASYSCRVLGAMRPPEDAVSR